MFSTLVGFALLGIASIVPQAAAQADPLNIALVQQQFVNALIVPQIIPQFSPSALLNVTFASVGNITTGEAVSMANAAVMPNFTAIGTDADFIGTNAVLNKSTKYTLAMIDGNFTGAPNQTTTNVHYLQNDLTLEQVGTDVAAFTNTTAPVIAYVGPAPPSGNGAHRYIPLLFAQPDNFKAPANPPVGTFIIMLDFPAYVQEGGLIGPIAGNYFTVEVGTSTVSASPTTSVNPATLQVASAAASGSKSVQSGTTTAVPTTSKNASDQGINGNMGSVVLASVAVVLFSWTV